MGKPETERGRGRGRVGEEIEVGILWGKEFSHREPEDRMTEDENRQGFPSAPFKLH